MPLLLEESAGQLMEVVPLVMRTIRSEMRSHRTPNLSVPQSRVLAHLDRQEGISLAALADFLGMTPPSASKLVQGLVARGLVVRQQSIRDRRQVRLGLTAAGQDRLELARRATLQRLAQMLVRLPLPERETLAEALRSLRVIFG